MTQSVKGLNKTEFNWYINPIIRSHSVMKDSHQDSHTRVASKIHPQRVGQLLLPSQIWTSHPVQTAHKTQQTKGSPLQQTENRPFRDVSLWHCPNDYRTLAPVLPSAGCPKECCLAKSHSLREKLYDAWPCGVEEDCDIRWDHKIERLKEAIDNEKE